MSKQYPQSIIKYFGLFLVLLVNGLDSGFSQAQEKPPTYYRIANLSPLGTEKLDVYMGESPLARKTKPGFYMGYTPMDFKPSSVFNLKIGDQILHSARLPDSKTARFFTILVLSEGSRPKLEILDDTPPEKIDDTTGESIPLKRLRVFYNSYGIPVKIEAGELLTWASKTGNDTLKAEKVFLDTKTNTIKATFLDDQKMPVDLFFPLDFNANRANSVFISQRGPQRLRVISYPDAVEPIEPTEEEASVVNGEINRN